MYKVVLASGLVDFAYYFINLSYMIMGPYANTILGQMETEQFLHYKDYTNALKECVRNNNLSLFKIFFN